MKKILTPFLAALAACALFSCADVGPAETDFFAMDTYMTVKAYGANAETVRKAETEAKRLESLFSVTDEKSEISRLNREGRVAASRETAELIREALAISRTTDGALDVTVYPAVKAWGFTTDEHRTPETEELEILKRNIGYGSVILDGDGISVPDGFGIDLGAVAKGYLGDRILETLKKDGVSSAIVDLGGNVAALGTRPDGSLWRVAIRDPRSDGTIGVIEVADRSVVTSGGYERFFTDENGVRRSHIIDPETAAPADSGILSATVVGSDGTLCDGLSTAIFVMGAERAEALWRKEYGFGMILVTEDCRILVTEDISEAFAPDPNAGYEVVVIKR